MTKQHRSSFRGSRNLLVVLCTLTLLLCFGAVSAHASTSLTPTGLGLIPAVGENSTLWSWLWMSTLSALCIWLAYVLQKSKKDRK